MPATPRVVSRITPRAPRTRGGLPEGDSLSSPSVHDILVSRARSLRIVPYPLSFLVLGVVPLSTQVSTSTRQWYPGPNRPARPVLVKYRRLSRHGSLGVAVRPSEKPKGSRSIQWRRSSQRNRQRCEKTPSPSLRKPSRRKPMYKPRGNAIDYPPLKAY